MEALQTDTQGRNEEIGTGKSRAHGIIQVVEFILGREKFAVELFDTKEVITTPDITPIPDAAPFISGIIDLRGIITTIVDLKMMMRITDDNEGKQHSRIIILDKNVSGRPIGILVDDVLSVVTYSQSDIDIHNKSDASNQRDLLGVIRKAHKGESAEQGKNACDLILWLDIAGMMNKIKDQL
ncbi:MAG: chemotaxis protein CheW [Euryarchaeota archaeon]|nr:chemotaxis protein CheW [Euryarchaeota archaeon]